MFFGVWQLPWWGYLVLLLGLTHVTIIGVTVYLHRCQAHRSLTMHPILSHAFRFWLWMTTGMLTKEWTAIHRKHHAKCETDQDPHSPQVLGLRTVLWEGTELYRREAKNLETLERYGEGTPCDAMERFYTRHSKKGILILLALELCLLGVPGLGIWALQMAWIPFFAAGIVNGVGHYWGYRNFECADASRNLFPWGIWIGGEELHNNHHTYPASARLSVKWWEIDLGWVYICLFRALGLVRVKRVPPKPQLVPGKTAIDGETLKAILLNRFQIMARYSKDVIFPMLRQEKQKDPQKRNLWKLMRRLLVLQESALDKQAKQRLTQLLADNLSMQRVYTFKKRLHDLWAKTSKEKELVEALTKWCEEAENSGFLALQRFAAYLRSFSLGATPA